jgi:tRNA threonylcarbamoyl adenosine modification protein YeaZ
MKILAVEFSTERRSVAIAEASGRESATVLAEVESSDRDTAALSLVETALRQARLEREAIDCIAVGLGPGSYTGIRSAIALAQGWQLARGTPLLGISSAEAIAAGAQAGGAAGRVAVVIDAQRGEFNLAIYDLSAAERRLIEPLKLASRDEAVAAARSGARMIGPELGNGLPQAEPVFPRAGMVARLAAGRCNFVPGESLEPIYLRPASFAKAPPPRFVP